MVKQRQYLTTLCLINVFQEYQKIPVKKNLKKASVLQISVAENVKFGPRGMILDMEKGKTLRIIRQEIPTSLEDLVSSKSLRMYHW